MPRTGADLRHPVQTGGVDGLNNLKVIEAVYESVRTPQPVTTG